MLIKLVVKIYSLNLVSAYWGYTLIVFMTQGYLTAKRLRTTDIMHAKRQNYYSSRFNWYSSRLFDARERGAALKESRICDKCWIYFSLVFFEVIFYRGGIICVG